MKYIDRLNVVVLIALFGTLVGGSSAYGGVDLVVGKEQTVTIEDSEYDNVYVLGGTLLAKGQLRVSSRLRIRGGEIAIDGSLDARSAGIDISRGRLTVSAPPRGRKNHAQFVYMGDGSIFETAGDWEVGRMLVLEGGTLQTPPQAPNRLSISASLFRVERGAGVHVSSSCAEPQNLEPIDGGFFHLNTSALDLRGHVSADGTHGYLGVGAGNGGDILIQAERITRFDGIVSARGGGTWNGMPPGKSGSIEIQVEQGPLPTTERLSARAGVFSGEIAHALANRKVLVRHSTGLPPLDIRFAADGFKVRFNQPINETFVLQRALTLNSPWNDTARFEAFDSGVRIRTVEATLAPGALPTGFFRLVKEPPPSRSH